MNNLKIFDINEKCTGCGACVSACPKKCISLERDAEGFYYPKYVESTCIVCKLCEKSCHVISKEEYAQISKEDFFLYADIDEVRTKSSSGGVFFRLASYTLSLNGVVFGSAYNPETSRLEVVNTEELNLSKIQKSKYIESYSGVSFSKVATDLRQQKLVLFCGTPCQVRGLKHYLKTTKTDDTKLITVDFICHGVPSSLCFDEYAKRFQSGKKKIINVDFRNKRFDRNGQRWHDMSLRFDYSDSTSVVIPYEQPYNFGYYKLFMDNVILRKCCYQCSLPASSVADFTIADFWGINMYRPNIDDNKGLSVLKIHTRKAEVFWNRINYNAPLFERLPFEAVEYIYKKRDKTCDLCKRDKFFSIYLQSGYKTAVCKYYGLVNLIKAYSIGLMKTRLKMILRRY